MQTNLQQLLELQKELATYQTIMALLSWDEEIHMPAQGLNNRLQQSNLLQKRCHEIITGERLRQLVAELQQDSELSEQHRVMVQRLARYIDKVSKLPGDFVEECSCAASTALSYWKQARERNEFSLFSPHLQKLVQLAQEKSRLLAVGGHPYNALLDGYEEGMTAEKLDVTFAVLKPQLKKLLDAIWHSDNYRRQRPLSYTISESQQQQSWQALIDWIGMPRDCFRLDISAHPFSINIGNNDVRMTTRYEANAPFASFLKVAHELGHCLYNLGVDPAYHNTALSGIASLGATESQSLFFENIIARGRYFWEKYFEQYRQICALGAIEQRQWYTEINRIAPTPVRLEADEVSYLLHIILRYQLELQLIDGSLAVADLPDKWRELSQELLEVEPPDDRLGVMQDIHWSWGNFGYFPTYAIGTIYSAQIYYTLLRQQPQIMRACDLPAIVDWLRENIHRHGRFYSSEELIQRCCGQPLAAEEYIHYLYEKYGELYQLEADKK